MNKLIFELFVILFLDLIYIHYNNNIIYLIESYNCGLGTMTIGMGPQSKI